MSEDNFTEDIRVRVPRSIKLAFDKLGSQKCKKESELAREAFMLYLARESTAEAVAAAQLNEVPSSSGLVAAGRVVGGAVDGLTGATKAPPPPIAPVKYKVPRRSKK